MACEQSAALSVHPSTPTGAVHSLTASVRVAEPGSLRFQYSLVADLAQVRLPPAGTGRRVDELWKHTCFEAFVATAGGGYCELNFSPTLDWAAYRFSGYRAGMLPAQLAAPPQMNVYLAQSALRLECAVAWRPTDIEQHTGTVRVALAAVIEAQDATLSYWAVKHAAGKPDFHHPEAFALELTI